MRLTVGPLPAAVYWRRRAVVLTAVAIVVLILFYSCSGSGGGKPTGAGATTATTSAAPAETGQVLTPTIEPSATASPPPATSAFVLPTSNAGGGDDGTDEAGQSGNCSDTEMVVTATPASGKAQAGAPVDFTIRFRNSGKRTCNRDIGADAQELRLMDGQTVIWSSDDCNARHGSDVRKFGPDEAVSFTLTWNGKRSRDATGAKVCADSTKAPDIGAYQLVGRLNTAYSSPAGLRLT